MIELEFIRIFKKKHVKLHIKTKKIHAKSKLIEQNDAQTIAKEFKVVLYRESVFE